MREIKFRAWDTKTKKMIFTGFRVIGEVTAFDMIDSYCMETKGDDVSMMRWNDIILMQFTGLKDKNGKEGYDSDIAEKDSIKWIIKWLDDEGCFILSSKEYGQLPIRKLKEMAIVGNIYEN